MELQKNKGYKAYFFAAIAVAIVGISLYAIVNIESIKAFINHLMLIFGPILYGFCLAYLCNPIMKVFDNYVFKKIKFLGLRRALSLTMTVLVVLAGIAVILYLLIPEIIRSIQHLLVREGFSSQYCGFHYLAAALYLAFNDPPLLSSLTKSLYAAVAEQHRTSASRVERDLRHIIRVTCLRSGRPVRSNGVMLRELLRQLRRDI